MRITINPGGVNEALALRMVAQISGKEDGTYTFSGGYTVTVRTGKSQRTYTVSQA